MLFLLLIFELTLVCFSLSSHLFRYQIAFVSCCVFLVFVFILSLFYVSVCSILTCICIFKKIMNVNSLSYLDESGS